MSRLLDLFCGAGGAAMGYYRAGFTEIVGVDNKPMPRYPFEFVQADALKYLAEYGHEFDVIHASPPCQRFSTLTRIRNNHPDLYDATRKLLDEIGVPWIIENVIGAPYKSGIVLCGSMFGLPVQRHRNFESNILLLLGLRCDHSIWGRFSKYNRPITITGNSGGRATRHSYKGVKSKWPEYMGMEWATPAECTQAIPPAYTEFIGKQLLKVLNAKPISD